MSKRVRAIRVGTTATAAATATDYDSEFLVQPNKQQVDNPFCHGPDQLFTFTCLSSALHVFVTPACLIKVRRMTFLFRPNENVFVL